MKRLIIYLFTIILVFTLCSCQNDNSNNVRKKSNDSVKVVLLDVLNGHNDFTFNKTEQKNIEKFTFSTEYNALNAFNPQGYAFVDCNDDNTDELLIIDASLQFVLLLRYENNTVYGYILDNIDFKSVKTDGRFKSRKNAFTLIQSVKFDGIDIKIEELAYFDDKTNIFKLNNKVCSKEQADEYLKKWDSNKNIEWETI